MNNNDSEIREIFKSRTTLLKQLNSMGYNTDTYEAYGFVEVNSLFNKNQLDMLIENDQGNKVYIKYHVGKTLRQNNIDEVVEDLFNIENTLEQNDKLIIIIKDIPNDTLNNIVKAYWDNNNLYISIRSVKTLQFNIFEHNYVPNHMILNEATEVNEFKKRFNIVDNSKIPEISRFDPVALALMMRPGEICKIIRPSKTAITSEFYRICI